MKIRWWPEQRTFVATWGERIIVGLTGHDRPSVFWHLRLKWHRYRYAIRGVRRVK